MVDVLTPAQRRTNMQRIRSTNTEPELKVRRLTHALGYRYRIHGRDLPGRPDLVFRPKKRVIFVHGCYWHMHHCSLGRVAPVSNAEFWRQKREGNVKRDERNLKALRDAGWRALVLWQCELHDVVRLRRRIKRFLDVAR